MLLLAGCGGSSAPAGQTVSGNGFSFRAPSAWSIGQRGGSVWASSGFERVEVLTFTLERPYRRALFAAAARELDGKMARLASQLRGTLRSRATHELAGGPARVYQIAYGSGMADEIAFVLSGSSEYELFCRRQGAEPDAACEELQSSFALATG